MSPCPLSEEELALGRFDSLDAYFAHMGDLLGTNKPMYMLLPLDEAPFTINANTRTVTIPNEFAKCGAVKGDNYCEIATFTIDRYFDYKDLAEAQIAVQWVNANKEEGISHIQLIDLESIEGKIRFGWPLTEDITRYPGQVQFAIRFYVPDPEDSKKFTYLLNTLTNTLLVRDGLNVVDPMHIRENDYDFFKKFVGNSQNPAYTMPVSPFFTSIGGGFDLPKFGAIDMDTDEMELTAQAVAKDGGTISYQWYYVPAGTTTKIPLSSNTTYTIDNNKPVKVDPIPAEKGLDKYWVNTGSEEATSWELYTGEWPPVEGTELYEFISSLKVNKTEDDVVGEYWVDAINTIGKNSTNPSSSTHCIVPAPNKIEYVKNLGAHAFAVNDGKGNTQVELAIELKHDNNNPDITYTWYKSTTSATEGYAKIDGAESKSYVAKDAGWYRVEPLSQLNRKVEENESNVCKVTKMPEAPVIQKLYYKLASATDYTELEKDQDMLPVFRFGDIVHLKIETDLDDASLLLTEGLTYQWYVQEVDQAARALSEKDMGVNTILDVDQNLNSKEIRVRCISDGAPYNYFCMITNTINGKTKDVNSSSYNTFTIE